MNSVKANHCELICKALYGCVESNEYCDTVIYTSTTPLYAHAVVLASVSSEMQLLLVHNRGDSASDKQYVLNVAAIGCSAENMSTLLKFCYTGVLEKISEGSVDSLYIAAQYLGVKTVGMLCLKYKQHAAKSSTVCSFTPQKNLGGEITKSVPPMAGSKKDSSFSEHSKEVVNQKETVVQTNVNFFESEKCSIKMEVLSDTMEDTSFSDVNTSDDETNMADESPATDGVVTPIRVFKSEKIEPPTMSSGLQQDTTGMDSEREISPSKNRTPLSPQMKEGHGMALVDLHIGLLESMNAGEKSGYNIKAEDGPSLAPGNGEPIKIIPAIQYKRRCRKMICPICDEEFTESKAAYIAHLGEHNGGKYPCDICHKQYANIYSLSKHKKMCHGEKAQCDQCLKVFKCALYLKEHIRNIHELSDGWPCSDCGKLYFHRSSLFKHRRKKHKDTSNVS